MSQFEHISSILDSMFGGPFPKPEDLPAVWAYRATHLPSYGICRTDSTLSIEAGVEINRQIHQGPIKPAIVCQVCIRWDCPVKKGTVDFDRQS